MLNWNKIGIFAGGLLFGTAGLKVLSSKDAKKLYAHTTAAVIRVKDTVMETVTNIREGAGDVLADAKEINRQREKDDFEIILDESETVTDTEEQNEDVSE